MERRRGRGNMMAMMKARKRRKEKNNVSVTSGKHKLH
jgi:hypothetical protein